MRKSLLLLSLVLFCGLALAQEKTVVGKVTAASTGEELPGVTILIKGTTQGANTNIDGTFKIAIPSDDAILIFSFIGYLPEEVEVGSRSVIDMSLTEDLQQLDEIIVVGYGTQKKSVATAAVTKIDETKLKGFAAPQLGQMLQGQVAGVIFKQSSGQPGASPTILIRGIGTNGDNNPLIIVDGLVLTDGSLSSLNPDDVENVQVLKDGASAAIYGARAANGIIMVTTKKAKSGETRLNYSFNSGVNRAWRIPEMMNSTQYVNAITEKYQNGNATLPVGFPTIDNIANDTDWMNEIFGAGKTTTHQLSVSKGTESSTLFSSISYWSQTGLIEPEKSYSNRITARLNYENKINSWLTIGQKVFYTGNTGESIAENNEFGTAIADALVYDPTTAVYDTAAQFGYAQSPFVQKEYINPKSRLFTNNNHGAYNSLRGDLYLTLTPIKGLTVKTDFGISNGSGTSGGFVPSYKLTPAIENVTNDVYENYNEEFRWQWENYATYQKQFGSHSIEATAGTTVQKINGRGFGGNSSSIPSEVEFDPNFWYIENTPDSLKRSYSYGNETDILASVFGRVIYNYQEKYLANITMRRDGSSKFGANNRFGVFPSISLGWVISREDFYNLDLVSNLKLRASYGVNGNDRIRRLGYAALIGNTGAYQFGKPDGQGVYPGQSSLFVENPNLQWEESRHLDIGLEFGLFGNAISVELDYYNKVTSGLLMAATTATPVGNFPPIANVGGIVNKGFEIDVNYQKTFGEFKFGASFNGATLKNEVTKVIDGGIINGYTWPIRNTVITNMQVGSPISHFLGYKTDGIFKSEDDVFAHVNSNGDPLQPIAVPGDIKYVDVNGDGVIDAKDITEIGKPWADVMLGLNLSLSYKMFDARVLFSSSIGNEVFRSYERQDVPNNNYMAVWEDRWSETNPDGEYPRLTMDDKNNNVRPSDFYVENASFLRIKNLQVGFNAPSSWMKAAKINSFRLYFSADNLMTITGYTGFDPEIGSSGWILDTGIDKGFYPLSRTFSFGLNLSL